MKTKASSVLGIGVAVVFFLTLLGGGSFFLPLGEVAIAEAGPNVSVAPAPVPYKKKTKVWISGSGFKPKQEVGIRVFMGGVLSDISFLVKPRPIANKYGAFSSVWKLNREIRRKLVKPGTAYTITIVNEDGHALGTAPLVFDKAKKKAKKKKKK
ncbi:MAG: hypothetical protein ACE5HC_13190 [Candidatus Binatia bacterium]